MISDEYEMTLTKQRNNDNEDEKGYVNKTGEKKGVYKTQPYPADPKKMTQKEKRGKSSRIKQEGGGETATSDNL